jgi:CRISPR-associated protein Cmr4
MSDTTNSKPEIQKLEQRILYLFTRTPLHVGAGASVGAIDQPIIRERHTGFPVIPATTLKGTFADAWLTDDMPRNDKGERVRVKAMQENEKTVLEATAAAWLFGSDDANHSFAGALQFSEAKLLAFPIRSAKGSFAWITCPLMLRRAARDGIFTANLVPATAPGDEQALFAGAGPLALEVEVTKNGQKQKVKQVVLEEYTFTYASDLPEHLGSALQNLLKGDEVWKEVANRLVILSDGMMSFFAQNACEVAQHVRISDETGTAEGGALFNQENVPSETMFYAVVHFFKGRGEKFRDKTPEHARKAFADKLGDVKNVFQFGGDASTGLGYCTVALADPALAQPPASS